MRNKMKAGDREKKGKFWFVWVICPDCGEGRWVQEGRMKMPTFTGRCNKCRLKIAKQEMGRFSPPK